SRHHVLYPLSLHDALPISPCKAIPFNAADIANSRTPNQTLRPARLASVKSSSSVIIVLFELAKSALPPNKLGTVFEIALISALRSEEHTSELQSRFDLACR